MRKTLIIVFAGVLIIGIIILAVYQLGVLGNDEIVSNNEDISKATNIVQFLESLDLASDFKIISQKLPSGVIQEILPTATSNLGVIDPFKLNSSNFENPISD